MPTVLVCRRDGILAVITRALTKGVKNNLGKSFTLREFKKTPLGWL